MDEKTTIPSIYIFFRLMVIYRTGSLLRAWNGIVTYGLGADNFLPRWLSWDDRIFKRSGEVLGSAGISDPRAEISGNIVKVQRSREEVPLLAGFFLFFFFQSLFLFFFLERGHCN